MIVVDSSVWVDFLRGAKSAQRRALHELIEDEQDLALTEIILTEVLQGTTSDSAFRTMRGFLLDFPIVRPKGIETYVRAAQIHRDCRRRGRTVRKTVDCIIASICIEHDHVLLHRDRDFDVIERCVGLKCVPV